MDPARKKLIIGVLTVALGLLVLFLMVLLSSNRDIVRVEVIALPEDSNITLNGEPIEAGVVSLEPGSHTLTASREYFSDAEITIHTDDLLPDEPIYLLPIPDTQEALDMIANDPDLQMQREEAGGLEGERTQRAILREHPYVEELPYQTIDYRIDYGFDEDDNIFFTVTLYMPAATPPGSEEYDRQAAIFEERALNYLQDIGVDTNEANITFKPAD